MSEKTGAEKAKELIKDVDTLKENYEQKNQQIEDLKTELGELKSKDSVSKEEFESFVSKFDIVNEEISKLKGVDDASKVISVKDQIKDAFGKNGESIKKLQKNEKAGTFKFKLDLKSTNKALANTGSISGNTRGLYLDEIGMYETRLSVLEEAIGDKRTIDPDGTHSTIYYPDWNDANITRNSAAIAEGAAFPEDEIGFIQRSIKIRKIGTTIPITEELMTDASMFADEISMSLMTGNKLEIERQIWTGLDANNELVGILNSGISPYTAGSDRVPLANIYDMLRKMRGKITATGGNKYVPNDVFMNVDDIDELVLAKDNEGRYLFKELQMVGDGMYQLGTFRIYEANVVTANTLVLCDARYMRLYRTNEAMVDVGYVDAQFREDEMTIKIRERMAFLIRGADVGGFRNVANINTELTTLAS